MSGTYEEFRELRTGAGIPTAKIAELAKCGRFDVWRYENGKDGKLAEQLWKALRSLQPKEAKEEIRPQNLLTITKVYESVFEHDGYNLRAWWEPVYGGGWDVAVHVMGVVRIIPPWQQVVPKSSEREVVVKTAELLSSMKRIMLVASEKTHGVRLAIADGQIAIETDNPDLGDGRELLDAKLSGTPITIGFSGRYLIDVLQEIQTPEVRISLGNDLDPAMIAPVDDGKDGNRALFVIMPMRL